MKKNLKKVLSLCLALVMVLGILPLTAFAVDHELYIEYQDKTTGEFVKADSVTVQAGSQNKVLLQARNSIDPDVMNADCRWVSSNPDIASVTASGYVYGNKPGTVMIYAYLPGEGDFPAHIAVTVPGAATHKMWLSMYNPYESSDGILSSGTLTVKRYQDMYLSAYDEAVPESYLTRNYSGWTWTSSNENVATIGGHDISGATLRARNAGSTVITAEDGNGNSVSVNVTVENAPVPGKLINLYWYDEETDTTPIDINNRIISYNSDTFAWPASIITVGTEFRAGAYNDNEKNNPEMLEPGWYTWHTSDSSIIEIVNDGVVGSDGRPTAKLICKNPGKVQIWASDGYPNIVREINLIVVEEGHVHEENHTEHVVYPEPNWIGQLGYNSYNCSCGWYFDMKDIPAGATEEQFDHEYVETERKEPTATADGYIKYECSCGATKTEVLPATGTECPSKNFVDVPGESNWAHAGIDYVVSKGLMNGIDATHFAPADDVTRAMLVTILWANEGKPAVTTDKKFSDVPSNKWYAGAVAWAAENGIVSGRSATTFAPDDAVTRQDLALILKKYAEFKGISGAAAGNLDAFADKGSVSKYAQNAVAWAVANGIISGSNEGGKLYLNPADSATRGQTAAILMKFFENVK